MSGARADDGARVLPRAGSLLAVFADGCDRGDALECQAHRVVGYMVVQRVKRAPCGAEARFAGDCAMRGRARDEGRARRPWDEDDRVVGAVVCGGRRVLRLDASRQSGGENFALLGAALPFVAGGAE